MDKDKSYSREKRRLLGAAAKDLRLFNRVSQIKGPTVNSTRNRSRVSEEN
jgi:hypothetical protein